MVHQHPAQTGHWSPHEVWRSLFTLRLDIKTFCIAGHCKTWQVTTAELGKLLQSTTDLEMKQYSYY